MAETLREKKRRILGNKSNYLKNKTGVLSNLGSLGQFISDDTNNLDNLSFATDKGLKVNLANNRDKEAGDPKIKVEDMDFSGSSLVGASALNKTMDSQPAMQPRWNAVIEKNKNVRGSATKSFIEENSAKANFKPYYLPISDGEEYYVESPEEEKFLETSTIEERDAYFSMNPTEAANFLANRVPPKNRFGHETGFEQPKPTGMNALYQELDPELDPLMSMLDGETFEGQDDALMSATEISEYDEALADGNMDLAKKIREKGNADNYQRFEDLRKLYPNQAMTSKYYPDVDYSSQDVIDDIKQKNNDNLTGVFDFWDPMMSTIGFADNAENTQKYSKGGDSGIFGFKRVNLDPEGVHDINAVNARKVAEDDEALILDDIYKNRYGFTEDDALIDQQAGSSESGFTLPSAEELDASLIDQQAGSGQLNNQLEAEALDQDIAIDEQAIAAGDPEVPKETLEMMDEQQNYEVTPQKIEKEKAEVEVASQALDRHDPTIRAIVDEEINKSQANGDSQEETESKLSELFGGLKDIFGVDNKSLLRAFVKYVGGRVFGLSSGKAAAFAWAGIEADMATESAKGAEAKKYADNMSEYKLQHSQALKAKDFDKAEMIMKKMLDYSGVDKSDPEKYYEGLEFLQNKKAELMASSDPKDKELIQAIDDQINKWESAGIGGSTTPQSTYDIRVQDEMGNERTLNARDGANGREVQMPNGKFVPLKDYKSEGFGSILHASKVNASDAGPDPFKMDGKRYDSDTDAEYEKLIDDIDSKVEAGTMSEEDAFNERAKVQNANNNRNSEGELYKKKIPFATYVSDTGVVSFPEFKEAEKKSAYQLAEGARGLAKLKAIQENPKAMAQVNKWTAQWESIATGNEMDYGALRSFISREYRANPLQQAYYMGMLELTTSKLRRDTGAAYNMKEMYDTMTRYTNYKDSSSDVTEMKLAGAEVDLEAIAGMTRSGQYWLGVMDGTYRPSDSWQNMMGNIYNMMEDAGAYSTKKSFSDDNNSSTDESIEERFKDVT